MSASLDESTYNYTLDAPFELSTIFYLLLGDNASGYSSSSFDYDAYALHIDIGSNYTILTSDSTVSTNFTIYDRFGNPLVNSIDYGTYSAYTFTASDSLYYIATYSNGSGYYGLRAENNSIIEANGIGEVITGGVVYSALVDYASDSDHYLFGAIAGRTYAVIVNSSLPDLFLKVADANTGQLTGFTSTGGGTYVFTAPYTGTFDLAISSNNFYTTGSYSFIAGEITAPFIVSNGGAATASVSLTENSTAVTTVTANDIDPGTALLYTIIGGVDAASFQIISATGVLSFITSPNFEVPTDVGGNGVYDVIVQVSDGILIDTQAISVTVTDENEAPSITSNGSGATASVSIAENSTAVTTVTANDPDSNTTLAYSISGGADSGRFQINSSTGALSFINAPNFEAPTDANTDNVYEVIVQASDGTLTDTQTISVTVTDLNNDLGLATNGDDILFASAVPDAFNGLLGSDTVSYINATSGVIANLSKPAVNKGFAQGDTYISIENLIGSSFNDTLTGDANANVLTGGAGVDKLAGGTGNDTYNVNLTSAGKLEDKVTEASKIASEVDRIVLSGTSTNAAAVTLKLGANIEDLDASATGSSLLNLTGSALSNTMIGNAAANVITGGALGDTMDGRDGSDVYVVASAADFNGDTINDTGSSGVDEFRFAGKAAATLNLNAVGLERVAIGTGTGVNAITTGKGAININASGVANGLEMIGNNGNNALTGTGFNDVLQGNSGNDNLNGGAGNDDLYGGLGNDILTGGLGMDSFVFNTTPNATKNFDTITDFNVADDTIELENAIFATLGTTPGILSAGAFVIGTAALDAASRIVYNSDTGALFYDSDGNAQGGSIQIATLATGLLLTNDDFLII